MKVKDEPNVIKSFIKTISYLKCFKQKYVIHREICFVSITKQLVKDFLPELCTNCPYSRLRFYELLK